MAGRNGFEVRTSGAVNGFGPHGPGDEEVLEAELRLARAENGELSAKLEEFESQAMAQKYQLEHEKSHWAGERARLAARVVELEAAMDGERRLLADELDAAHGVMHHANEDLKESFSDLQDQCRELERENARLRQQRTQWMDRQNRVPSGPCATCQARSREASALSASKLALESEVRGLKRALSNATRAPPPAKPVKPATRPGAVETAGVIADLKRRNTELQTQLSAAQTELRMQQSEEEDVMIMSAEVQRLRHELDESRGPLDVSRAHSQSAASDADDEVIVLKAHLETLSEEAARFRKLADSSFEDANAAVHDARASFDMQRKLEAALQQALARLQDLEVDNDRLRRNLETQGLDPEAAATPRTTLAGELETHVARELHAEIRRLRHKEVSLEDLVARLRTRLQDLGTRYHSRTGSSFGHDSRDGEDEDVDEFVASLESEVHRSRLAIREGQELLSRSRQNQQELDELSRAGQEASEADPEEPSDLNISRVSFSGSVGSFLASTPQRQRPHTTTEASPLAVKTDPEIVALRKALGAEADVGMRIVAAVHKLKDALRNLIDPKSAHREGESLEGRSLVEARAVGSPYKYSDEMGGLTPRGAEQVARMRLSDVQMACEQMRGLVEGHLERHHSVEELRQYCEHLESMLVEATGSKP